MTLPARPSYALAVATGQTPTAGTCVLKLSNLRFNVITASIAPPPPARPAAQSMPFPALRRTPCTAIPFDLAAAVSQPPLTCKLFCGWSVSGSQCFRFQG
eukprot:1147783-Rhodomonas_salina.2